jgi:hypothetical protein
MIRRRTDSVANREPMAREYLDALAGDAEPPRWRSGPWVVAAILVFGLVYSFTLRWAIRDTVATIEAERTRPNGSLLSFPMHVGLRCTLDEVLRQAKEQSGGKPEPAARPDAVRR